MADGASMMTLQMGSGAALGFITGYAIKKIFQAILFIIGVFFAGIFGLASQGAVTIHYDKLLGSTDAGLARVADYLSGTSGVLLQHFPISAGFGLGFVYAMRK